MTEADDATSAYTGYTSEPGIIDIKDRITEDFFTQQGQPRSFEKFIHENKEDPVKCCKTSVLQYLEISDYDAIKTHEKLFVNVMGAFRDCKVRWKTVDKDKIVRLIRFCIIREINQIEGRKNSIEFRKWQDEHNEEDLLF